MTSPASRDSDQGRSSSKKSLNNKRTDATKDVDGQNMNIDHPLTDLCLDVKLAAEVFLYTLLSIIISIPCTVWMLNILFVAFTFHLSFAINVM